jgi:hypothetical protein
MQQTKNAKVLDAFGTTEKKVGTTWKRVSVGELLPVTTTLRTGANAAVLLLLPDQHRLRVGAQTTLTLNQLGVNKQFSIQVVQGQVWSLVRKASQPAKFEVTTPSAVAGVTGTFFLVDADEETGDTTVSTNEGSVQVRSIEEPDAPPVPVTQGRMTRFPRQRQKQRQPHTAHAVMQQSREHQQMWKMVHKEGAWTQQAGRNGFRLLRQNEIQLRTLLRGRRPKPQSKPGQKLAVSRRSSQSKIPRR